MPGKGIRNAVYKRAGGKGQSSKFYNIYGKVVKPTDPNGFKGGQIVQMLTVIVEDLLVNAPVVKADAKLKIHKYC